MQLFPCRVLVPILPGAHLVRRLQYCVEPNVEFTPHPLLSLYPLFSTSCRSVVDHVGADVVAEEQEWSGAYPANYAQKFEGPGHINTRGRGFKTWDTAGEIKTRDQAVTATSILFAVILVVLRQVYITTEPTPEPTIKRTQSTISFASK